MSASVQAVGRWQRRSDAQPLRWAAAAQLQRLRAVLGEADAAWRRGWGIAQATAPVHCVEGIASAGAADLQPLGQAAHGAAWVRWADADAATPFALAGDTPLAGAARAACGRDRVACLLRALALEAGAVHAAAAHVPAGRWSGAARALLPCGSELVVDGGCLAALAPRPRATAPATQGRPAVFSAAAHRHVRVQARLADCKLDVGALQCLQPGDVVRLDHALAQPLHVHATGGPALFRAFLSARAGFKALEFAAAPSSHPTEAAP